MVTTIGHYGKGQYFSSFNTLFTAGSLKQREGNRETNGWLLKITFILKYSPQIISTCSFPLLFQQTVLERGLQARILGAVPAVRHTGPRVSSHWQSSQTSEPNRHCFPKQRPLITENLWRASLGLVGQRALFCTEKHKSRGGMESRFPPHSSHRIDSGVGAPWTFSQGPVFLATFPNRAWNWLLGPPKLIPLPDTDATNICENSGPPEIHKRWDQWSWGSYFKVKSGRIRRNADCKTLFGTLSTMTWNFTAALNGKRGSNTFSDSVWFPFLDIFRKIHDILLSRLVSIVEKVERMNLKAVSGLLFPHRHCPHWQTPIHGHTQAELPWEALPPLKVGLGTFSSAGWKDLKAMFMRSALKCKCLLLTVAFCAYLPYSLRAYHRAWHGLAHNKYSVDEELKEESKNPDSYRSARIAWSWCFCFKPGFVFIHFI